MYSGYLDRFTDSNDALILVDALQQQFHVPAALLPVDSRVGTWFLVDIQDNSIIALQIDVDKTQTISQDIEDRMQRLKSKRTSRFKRN
ncbi:DUF3006 domain-containing protein [Sporosarcina beigongshangi]|uniref:DUF3006 domain-containing protein n=1 Tax=Sporosarcina beigongshangi TaxID=2782538 RepID=UPI00193971F9|nr:DUF3006 domain-containing protein [Sporosarcina beigongshangi]